MPVRNEATFTHGSQGSSSHFDPSWNQGFLQGSEFIWHSGHSQPRKPEKLPVFIWYEFADPQFCPIEISFHPRQNEPEADNFKKQTPTRFQFIGTNDENCSTNSDWTVICENQTRSPEFRNETRHCRVDPKNQLCQGFRCLGLKVLANKEMGWVSLNGIRMWLLSF